MGVIHFHFNSYNLMFVLFFTNEYATQWSFGLLSLTMLVDLVTRLIILYEKLGPRDIN
jgi:hypothetical protein